MGCDEFFFCILGYRVDDDDITPYISRELYAALESTVSV